MPVLVVLTVVGMLSLSCWQLSRYHYKSALLRECRAQLSLPRIDDWDPFVKQQRQDPFFRRVQVRGTYLNTRSILLDGRWNHEQLGYEVLTPFRVYRIPSRETYILVDRGWVKADVNRAQRPRIPAIFGVQTLQACVLGYPKKRGFMLGANVESVDFKAGATRQWPVRIQRIQVSDIERVTGLEFFPYILRLEQNSPGHSPNNFSGDVCVQQFSMMPIGHLGYAVQWVLLSIAVGIAYLIFLRSSQSRGGRAR